MIAHDIMCGSGQPNKPSNPSHYGTHAHTHTHTHIHTHQQQAHTNGTHARTRAPPSLTARKATDTYCGHVQPNVCKQVWNNIKCCNVLNPQLVILTHLEKQTRPSVVMANSTYSLNIRSVSISPPPPPLHTHPPGGVLKAITSSFCSDGGSDLFLLAARASAARQPGFK